MPLGFAEPPGQRGERRLILLAGESVSFLLKRSARRRTLALHVTADATAVHAPARASETEIVDFLHGHAAWLLAKRRELAARAPACMVWTSGTDLPFLGDVLSLDVKPAPSVSARREGAHLVVQLPEPGHVAELVDAVRRWYRREAIAYLPERLRTSTVRLGVALPALGITDAGSYWGRCSNRTGIRLNWRVMKLRPGLIDYIVAHEVAHLRHMNHGKRFWQLVARLCPDFESARAEVRDRAPHCFVF